MSKPKQAKKVVYVLAKGFYSKELDKMFLPGVYSTVYDNEKKALDGSKHAVRATKIKDIPEDDNKVYLNGKTVADTPKEPVKAPVDNKKSISTEAADKVIQELAKKGK